MIKIAVYGKGGIGKSTTVSNVAAALAEQGLKVLQIGCDPKADSTILLRHGEEVPTVLHMYQEKKQNLKLEDIVKIGYKGIVCVEAGGPTPGLGCAGRGIITALEKLEETGAYEKYQPDVVLYDVLGDVVCGGFSMPMRNGYADKIFIVTSGENMAIHAGANIAMAVENFKNRGYATLGGLILNRRNVPREEEKVEELAEDFHTSIVGTLTRSDLVQQAEEQKKTVLEAFPESEMAEEYRILAKAILMKVREKQEVSNGIVLERSEGKLSYTAGKGETGLTALGLYTTWFGNKGHYTDIVLRAGHLDHKMNTYGEYAERSDYDNAAYSISFEYGRQKNYEKGWFFTPQAQITLGRMNSVDFTTERGTKIDVDGLTSAIGRIGFEVGRKISPESSYYFKLGAFHEFDGDRDVSMVAANGENLRKRYDNGDTWYEFGMGAQVQLSRNTHFYGDIERSFGGDTKKEWQVNTGIRWEF